MKNFILIFLFIPIFLFSQSSEVNNIIHFKPASLFLGTLSVSYEREVFPKHSIYIGVPIYFKRDLTKSKIIRILAPYGDEYLYEIDQITNSTANDILDDVDGLAYISGSGFNFGYKFYLGENSDNLSGFYINPDFYTFKFKSDGQVNKQEIDFILSDNSYPDLFDDWDLNSILQYNIDGQINLRSFSLNIGHQWIRKWFAVDMKMGLGNYLIKYEYKDQILFDDQSAEINKEKDRVSIFLPRFKIKFGVYF